MPLRFVELAEELASGDSLELAGLHLKSLSNCAIFHWEARQMQPLRHHKRFSLIPLILNKRFRSAVSSEAIGIFMVCQDRAFLKRDYSLSSKL